MPTAVLGLRGTGNWATDERPLDWRSLMMFLYPNGSIPLTGFLSKLGKERTYDVDYKWWTKTLPEQGGTVSVVYTNSDLTTAYASGGVAGDMVYAKCAEAVADEFRPGHQVLLRYTSDHNVDVNAKVTNVSKNDASSYVACKLLEADDNSASYDLSDVDRILVIGNINVEGGEIPTPISYDPVKYSGRTQIFRTPLDITRTALQTRYRTGDKYKELKREALEMHGIEKEKAFLWGINTENTGSNGQNEGTTRGLISAIKTFAPGNVDTYNTNADYNGISWKAGGEDWLDEKLETIYRYGSTEKIAFVGTGTLLALKKLAKEGADIQITPGVVEYGIRVLTYVHTQGTLHMILHPLFSHEVTNRRSMVIFEPPKLRYRFIQDTKFYPDPNREKSGRGKADGITEEFLTECGLEFHFPVSFGYLNGLGVDNAAL